MDGNPVTALDARSFRALGEAGCRKLLCKAEVRLKRRGALASGEVSEIDIALSLGNGTGAARVSLWTDLVGGLGVQLGSLSMTAAPHFGVASNSPVTISGISDVRLTGGLAYWLHAKAEENTLAAWNSNRIGARGVVLINGRSVENTLAPSA